MPLSDRQLDAAHRSGQDVCVVAGPGSGKTSVLIERFSWLVREQRISPGRILAITFTDKAATEIKDRMVRAFADAPQIRQQIERAYVSTIHAFCARLLRENAIEAGVDPAFTVLDASLPVLRETADQVLEELYTQDKERMQRFLRSLAVAPERGGFVADLADSLIQMYEALRLAGGSWDGLDREPPPMAEDWSRLRQIAAEIASDRPVPRTERQKQQHADAFAWATSVLELPSGLSEGHFSALKRPNLNPNSLIKGSATCAHEAELRELCSTLTGASLAHYYADERALIAVLLKRIDEQYRKRKRDTSALDFDDLEEFSIKLLEKDPALRAQVRDNFDFILMDELQDTNPLQWKLIELVRKPDNFFAVGDVNQSIYGFRHAQPELFGAYRSGLETAGLVVDELRENYRSRPEVLATVNRVFAGTRGIEPHELTAGREFAAAGAPCAEVIVSFGDDAAEAERIEALWVARRITELAGSVTVTDRDGATRKATFGDIAVLARANYSTAELQKALDDFGVPSVVVGGLTFFDTREVRDLRLLLDVLVNPRNDISLAGFLRSPFFGVSDERLMQLMTSGSLVRSVEENPPDGWRTVAELRSIRNLVSPDRLLRRMMDERDYESGLAGRARANIDKFLAMLRDRYARNPAPLASIVATLDEAAPEAEAPPSESTNAVRLMTLHKAKGLEFPIVFLPYLHKGRSYSFPNISYSKERGLGVRWRNPATNLGEGDAYWQANRKQALDSQEAEENRLLYVGMTRAREHIVLSWSSTGRERGAAPRLISTQLGLDTNAATNAVELNHTVRLFLTDVPPTEAASLDTAAAQREADLLPVIASADGADSSASVTDISRFHECPRRYYLSRYLRWDAQPPVRINPATDDDSPEELPADMTASELGRLVHAILAGQPADKSSPEATQLADRFVTSQLGKRAARAQSKAHEWDFLFSAAGLVLRGQIDLWFEHNRELIVVDYKTDREINPHTVAGHSLQVQLYALALEQWMGRRPDRGVLYFVRPNTEVEVDLSPLALGAATTAVREFHEAQSRLEFPLRPGNQCWRCEFHRGLCPADLTLGVAAGQRS